MSCTTHAPTPATTAGAIDAATGPERRQGLAVLGLLATVVVLDQSTKWWGWRHAPEAVINAGGTWLIGRPVSGWFSGPVSGPLLDLLNVGLLTLAGLILVRRPRRAPGLVSGALMIGGWGSNLLDRLGMHSLTAPGSIRGAVDFIPVGQPYWNVADFVIIGATALFLVARCVRGDRGRAASRPMAPVALRPWGPLRTCMAAAGLGAAVVLSVPAAIGAQSDVGVESARRVPVGAGSHG
jgi:lipoprotein signal peptidase